MWRISIMFLTPQPNFRWTWYRSEILVPLKISLYSEGFFERRIVLLFQEHLKNCLQKGKIGGIFMAVGSSVGKRVKWPENRRVKWPGNGLSV